MSVLFVQPGTVAVMEDVTAVSEDVTAVKQEVPTVSEDVTAVKEEVTNVSEDVTAVKQDVTAVMEDVTAVSEDVTAVKQDVTAVTEDVTAVKQEVTTVSEDVTAVSEDVTAVSEDVTAVKEEVTTVSEDVTAVKEEVTTVSEDVTAVSEDVTAVKQDATAVKKDFTAVKQDVTAVSEDVTAVKQEVTTVSEDVTAVKQEVTTVSEDVTAVMEEVTTVSEDVTAVKEDVTTVSEDVTAVKQEVTTVSEDVTAVKQEVADWGEYNTAMRKGVAAVKEDVSAMRHFSFAKEEPRAVSTSNSKIKNRRMAEKASTSQADEDQQYTIRILYSDMALNLSEMISPDRKLTWQRLLTVLDPLLPHHLRGDDITYIGDILEKLRAKGQIVPMKGSFEKLYDALLKVNVEAAKVVKETSVNIKALLSEGPLAARKPGTERNGNQIKGRNPKLKAMKETTRLRTLDQTSKPEVISTQALEDAKEMIRKNSVVLIKGASGDGKTLMCYQLLKWLMDGDNKDTRLSKDPVQLYSMAKWDEIVEPNTQLAVYIDDVSGEIAEELKKREVSIKSRFCGKLNNRSNCLILNVRDEIFKSTQLLSCEFFKQNIIDLRGKNCIKISEKKLILESYVREIKTFPSGKESEIIKLDPDIGFPQCCRLYRDVPSLQKEGVHFFKQPFHFMETTLEKLPKEHFSALLFLFLNEGRVKKGDLDPKNSESVDKKKLDEAFQGIKLDHADKIRSLQKSLNVMFGSLVAKRKYPFHNFDDDDDDDDVFYQFCHDSVQDTVALMYGKDTKIGFIENCPRKYLHYISTSKSTANKIVIKPSSEHMYKRLVRECESDVGREKDHRLSDYIVRLDVWTDTLFLQGFISWLSGQNDDKNLHQLIKSTLLNGACSAGLEDRVSYLLSVGATPDNDTPFSVVKGGSVQLLTQLLKYDVIPTARADRSRSSYYTENINVLHEACLFKREEMVTMLCDTYPDLVHETDNRRHSTLHLMALTGSVGLFQTVERTILKSLCRVEDVQQKCETEDGRVVHRSCVCGQYMSQLEDDDGWTILHLSCGEGHRELSLYLCQCYPALTTAVDIDGYTVLHHSCSQGHRELSLELSRWTSDVDMFTDCERHVKLNVEKTGGKYDITTILTNDGRSVLDLGKEWIEWADLDNSPLYDHLVKVFNK
ncbi:uncharacterized protein LOC117317518 [Pecten maximus]|uniref:uncharacterized protein LOC117317518 n=1 Tax=Pecten maximus TaxID=6579 RepID=UPI00145880EA|nr:uncharacterized protein LOC117317518 [Pecten maximus]